MKRRARLALAWVGIAALVAAPALARASEGPLERTAGAWLELLDTGRFDDAWRGGAALLRREGEAQWTEETRRLREEYGPVESRTAVVKDYHQQLEGAPDGVYFTLRFRTLLASGGEIVEVVTLTPEADQQYRVAVYGIKR